MSTVGHANICSWADGTTACLPVPGRDFGSRLTGHLHQGDFMKLILTNAMLALAIVASPAAARLSQPGNPNSPMVSDHRSAVIQHGDSNMVARLAQAGSPSSALLGEPRNSAPPMAMAMISCCPDATGTPGRDAG